MTALIHELKDPNAEKIVVTGKVVVPQRNWDLNSPEDRAKARCLAKCLIESCDIIERGGEK